MKSFEISVINLLIDTKRIGIPSYTENTKCIRDSSIFQQHRKRTPITIQVVLETINIINYKFILGEF
jgi:hypothetical protein